MGFTRAGLTPHMLTCRWERDVYVRDSVRRHEEYNGRKGFQLMLGFHNNNNKPPL